MPESDHDRGEEQQADPARENDDARADHHHESPQDPPQEGDLDVGEADEVLPALGSGLVDASLEPVTPNPLSTVDFNLSVPPIDVQMVNASALEDYEIWLFVASVFASGLVGFLVAYIQSFHTARGVTTSEPTYLVMSVLCLVVLIVSFVRALVVRNRIKHGSTTYRMRASGIMDQ